MVTEDVVWCLYKVVTRLCFRYHMFVHKLRLMKVVSRWPKFVILWSYCHDVFHGYTPCLIRGHVDGTLWTHQILERDMKRPAWRFHHRVKLLTVGYTAWSVNGAYGTYHLDDNKYKTQPILLAGSVPVTLLPRNFLWHRIQSNYFGCKGVNCPG